MRCKQAWWVMFWMNGMDDPKRWKHKDASSDNSTCCHLYLYWVLWLWYDLLMISLWLSSSPSCMVLLCCNPDFHGFFSSSSLSPSASPRIALPWWGIGIVNTLGAESSQVWTVVVFEAFGCSLVFENIFQNWLLSNFFKGEVGDFFGGDRWIGEFSVFHQEAARKKKEKERTREREMQHYFHPCLHSHCPNHEGSSHEHSHRQNTNPPVITNMAGWTSSSGCFSIVVLVFGGCIPRKANLPNLAQHFSRGKGDERSSRWQAQGESSSVLEFWHQTGSLIKGNIWGKSFQTMLVFVRKYGGRLVQDHNSRDIRVEASPIQGHWRSIYWFSKSFWG